MKTLLKRLMSGKGNTYQNFYINHVENLNPSATTVIYKYYGTREEKQKSVSNSQQTNIDPQPIRQEILHYVSSLRCHLADAWKSSYMQLWEEILNLEVVSSSIYNPGKQQGTNFNRNLVAGIIYYLVKKGIFGGEQKYNATQFAICLEGSGDHSVRAALKDLPSPEIASRLDRLLETRETA